MKSCRGFPCSRLLATPDNSCRGFGKAPWVECVEVSTRLSDMWLHSKWHCREVLVQVEVVVEVEVSDEMELCLEMDQILQVLGLRVLLLGHRLCWAYML